MARRKEEDLSVGEDSFMDTIANLVGIMIILMVIVGAKDTTPHVTWLVSKPKTRCSS